MRFTTQQALAKANKYFFALGGFRVDSVRARACFADGPGVAIRASGVGSKGG